MHSCMQFYIFILTLYLTTMRHNTHYPPTRTPHARTRAHTHARTHPPPPHTHHPNGPHKRQLAPPTTPLPRSTSSWQSCSNGCRFNACRSNGCHSKGCHSNGCHSIKCNSNGCHFNGCHSNGCHTVHSKL